MLGAVVVCLQTSNPIIQSFGMYTALKLNLYLSEHTWAHWHGNCINLLVLWQSSYLLNGVLETIISVI
jgi:hypothetical protein